MGSPARSSWENYWIESEHMYIENLFLKTVERWQNLFEI
jgi:hypothetical protein